MGNVRGKNWDTTHSTYWWNIHLDESQRQPMLRGYSAVVGEPENTNKINLLKVKYRMFLNQGYLDRMKYIEIFRRVGGIIDLHGDIKIVTLYPQSFEFTDVTSLECKGTYRMLESIYEIRKGNPDAKLPNLNYGKSAITKDDKASHLKRVNDFKTLDELVNECNAMQQRGIAPGQIQHFYKSIIERKPHLK